MLEVICMVVVITGMIGYAAIVKWNMSMNSSKDNL